MLGQQDPPQEPDRESHDETRGSYPTPIAWPIFRIPGFRSTILPAMAAAGYVTHRRMQGLVDVKQGGGQAHEQRKTRQPPKSTSRVWLEGLWANPRPMHHQDRRPRAHRSRTSHTSSCRSPNREQPRVANPLPSGRILPMAQLGRDQVDWPRLPGGLSLRGSDKADATRRVRQSIKR